MRRDPPVKGSAPAGTGAWLVVYLGLRRIFLSMASCMGQCTYIIAGDFAMFAVDPMDRRSLYKRLYPLARFKNGNTVFFNGRLCEVVKRYYRMSEERVLYDVRDARTNDVRVGITEQELLSPTEHHARS